MHVLYFWLGVKTFHEYMIAIDPPMELSLLDFGYFIFEVIILVILLISILAVGTYT